MLKKQEKKYLSKIWVKNPFLKGSIFLLLASICSITNDIIMKYIPTNAIDTLFLRFFFANLALLPIILIKYINSNIKIKNIEIKKLRPKIIIHAIRSGLLAIGMLFYITSLKKLPLPTTIIINFSIPLWVVIFSRIFLKEYIRTRLIAVLISLIGIIITCFDSMVHHNGIFTIILLFAAFCFALLDIFNKHLINQEQSMMSMIIGSNLGILIISAPFFSYQTPLCFFPFILLGINANLLLYFILKAWQSMDISALQSIKYIEFPLAIYFNWKIFHQNTSWMVILGFIVLIFGMSLNIYKEMNNK